MAAVVLCVTAVWWGPGWPVRVHLALGRMPRPHSTVQALGASKAPKRHARQPPTKRRVLAVDPAAGQAALRGACSWAACLRAVQHFPEAHMPGNGVIII